MSEAHYGAGVVVENDGEFLLVQEGKDYVEGLWNLPSGGHEVGETIRETAKREVKEETGLEVKLDGLIGLYSRRSKKNEDQLLVLVVFEGSVEKKPVQPEKDQEIKSAEWIQEEKLDSLEKRFDWMEIIRDFRNDGSKDVNLKHLEI